MAVEFKPAPVSPRFAENRQRTESNLRGGDPCRLCGKGVRGNGAAVIALAPNPAKGRGTEWEMVNIGTPEGAAWAEAHTDEWLRIGADCARKIPAAFRAR